MFPRLFTISLATLMPTLAHAYIGPGAGAGTIAVVLGVIAAVFMAVVGLVWYPLKRLFRGRKPARTATGSPERSSGNS
ncbi:MAG: hypothetical protein R3C97_00430 [Geminicoccaceae bacterium]